MKIPLDSVCAVQWFAYSDWCQDNNRQEASAFAVNVGRAITTLTAAGVECRMLLYHARKPNKEFRSTSRFQYRHLSPVWFRYEVRWADRSVVAAKGVRSVPLNECYWVWPNPEVLRVFTELEPGTPGDTLDPWRYGRVSRKFFYCLIQRAGVINAKGSDLRRAGD